VRRLALLLTLLASPAWAQVDNPTRLDFREEGTSQGRIFALNCIGTELLCAVSGGVGTLTFTSPATAPFDDATAIVKGSGDATKLLRFEVDGFTTGTTRVVTFTNADGTVPYLGSNNTWSATNTFNTVTISANQVLGFSASGSNDNSIQTATSSTPDIGLLGVGSNTRSWLIAERADSAFDFAHAQQTNPTLFVHSANQSTTEYSAYTWLGQAPNRTTVTVNGATTFAVSSGYVVLECTGAETINTITGGIAGAVLILENSDTECTLADDDSATASNAIDLTGTATNDVGAVAKIITLIYNGSHWLQVSESDN
jgi:hypothetical protein